MIDMRIKALFFDTAKVVRAVDKARRKALSKAGAFIRTRARSSIRKRKRVSAPGQPPSSHEGTLKRFIFFGYDPQTKSVVIGPAKLSAKSGEQPRTLEEGGRTVIVRRRKSGHRTKRVVRIEPRPFMGPALEAERPRLAEPWADSIRG